MATSKQKISELRRLASQRQPRDRLGRFASHNNPGLGSTETQQRLRSALGRLKASGGAVVKKEVLGSGDYGTVYMTNRGTVYKEGRISHSEINGLKQASKLGVSPKVLSVGKDDENGNPSGFEMEFLGDHKPVYAVAKAKKLAGENDPEVAASISIAASKMHLNGILHGDFHGNNVLVKGRDAKVIDFGLSQQFDFSEEDPDPRRQALKNLVILKEIDQVHETSKLFGLSDHPVAKVYRDYADEIDDEMFLYEAHPPDDDDELVSYNDARTELIRRFHKDLRNAAS